MQECACTFPKWEIARAMFEWNMGTALSQTRRTQNVPRKRRRTNMATQRSMFQPHIYRAAGTHVLEIILQVWNIWRDQRWRRGSRPNDTYWQAPHRRGPSSSSWPSKLCENWSPASVATGFQTNNKRNWRVISYLVPGATIHPHVSYLLSLDTTHIW